ncbi:hypothetical protein BRO54_2505 [Geobacillus proteiniphilus]|uniref:Uncharacterized protein n=1 Tax=Geobacillus proteiniphilus TaxID=860353 RepID=A0A1Q5SVS0_9BACL|nr:hypothetical protein BRO54_2505 [Geobacillus proteiniphilus]
MIFFPRRCFEQPLGSASHGRGWWEKLDLERLLERPSAGLPQAPAG